VATMKPQLAFKYCYTLL